MVKNKPHYHDHRSRLKERYAKAGLNGFADYEIMELLLTFAIPRKDVKPIAKELIANFKTLRNVFDQPIEKLETQKGIGNHSATLINLVKDIITYYFEPEFEEKIALSSPESVSNYLKAELGHKEREYFMVICLNSANQIVNKETLFSGTINQAQVYPREIIKSALVNNASAIILVHNHPSGNPKPSNDDIVLTQVLEEIAEPFELRIHDHIVVTKSSAFSIKANRNI